MSRIVNILRAAHCRSTHHFFAIDALSRIETAPGRRLGDLLLKHHREYLMGAKAPDKTFKDFQNHVLHVGDNNWGGAPQACGKWAANAIEHLNAKRWRKAAFACGVLSHYFTDPLMPLHTAQSPREAIVHRPFEWSVCQAYDEIYREWSSAGLHINFRLSSSPDWASQAVQAAAAIAYPHYDRLLEIYDMKQAAVAPPLALNAEARRILCELFAVAITGWAQLLTRLADETETEIPNMKLGMATLLASIDIPLAWVVRRISNASEQRAVAAVLHEYETTGDVVRHLPNEVKTVARERAATPTQTQPAPAVQPTSLGRPRPTRSANENSLGGFQFPALQLALPDVDALANRDASATQRPALPRLNEQSNLVDAPSIGPKTAKRFEKIGIERVGQFLASQPEQLAQRLDTRWITTALISQWQDQSRLVCQIPALCGYEAQLLVAVDCRTRSQLEQQNARELHERLRNFCATPEAERILRSSSPPSANEVACWISAARDAKFKIAS